MTMTCRETESRTAAASTIACRLEGDDYRRVDAGEVASRILQRDAALWRPLVEEERVCCPFLVIESEETAEAMFVKITPPRLDPAMLGMLLDHFTAGIPARPSPHCLGARTNRPSRCGEIGVLRKHDL
jgi:hypothetical protein